MSTDWNNCNEFMGGWTKDDAEKDIEAIIEEHTLFKSCTDFKYTDEVNKVFDNLVDEATTVEALQIGAASSSGIADGCALNAVFTFGMSMAPFVIAEVVAAALTAAAASEQGALTKKMKSADVDIADKIGKDSNVAKWIKKYKANNGMIVSYCGKYLPTKEARKILFNFIANIEVSGEELTVESFRQHAKLCKLLWDSDTKDKVSDALDNLALSNRTPQDIADCLAALQNYNLAYFTTEILRNIFLTTAIKYMAQTWVIPSAEVREALDFLKGIEGFTEDIERVGLLVQANEGGRLVRTGSAKFFVGVDVIISVVDLFFEVFEIIEAVEQAEAIKTSLNYNMRPAYLKYFGHIKDGAREYNKTVVHRQHVMNTINDDTEA